MAEIASPQSTRGLGKRLRRAALLLAPALVILVGAAPQLNFQLPSTSDGLTESYQPLKTLKFLKSLGGYAHKWGPLPNFIYAPAFAPMMGYWHVTGDFSDPSEDYPYGLARPHEQMGLMILVGRSIVLILGLLSITMFTWMLAGVTKRPALTSLAVIICAVSSPWLIKSFADTKPDGLMMAFLIAAMSMYVSIVWLGLTRKRGILLSIFAVCSVSCKEQTAPAFVLPYIGILVQGLWLSRGDRPKLRRFLGDYAICIAAGIVAYACINIVYAPQTWLERMDLLFFGSLKDPAIWAPPGQTAAGYTYKMLLAAVHVLGYGGSAMIIGAIGVTLWRRPRHAIMCWLPLISYCALMLLLAGYVPTYFMLPVTVLGAVAVVTVGAGAFGGDRLGRPGGALAKVVIVVAVIVCLAEVGGGIGSTRAWLNAKGGRMLERYVVANATKTQRLYSVSLWDGNVGSSRLAYLGYSLEHRGLGSLIETDGPWPELVFVNKARLEWLEDFKQRPARAEYWAKGTKFDYRRFNGFEELGYEHVDTLRAELPPYYLTWLYPGGGKFGDVHMLVYRLRRVENQGG